MCAIAPTISTRSFDRSSTVPGESHVRVGFLESMCCSDAFLNSVVGILDRCVLDAGLGGMIARGVRETARSRVSQGGGKLEMTSPRPTSQMQRAGGLINRDARSLRRMETEAGRVFSSGRTSSAIRAGVGPDGPIYRFIGPLQLSLGPARLA